MREPDFPLPPRTVEKLSPAEQDELHELHNLIMSIYLEVCNLRAAIALTHEAISMQNQLKRQAKTHDILPSGFMGKLQLISHWQKIGARAAVDAIFQFGDTLIGIEEWAQTAQVREKLANPNIASDSMSFFERYFPKWEVTRHAVAHSSEIRRTTERNQHKAGLSHGAIRKSKATAAMIQDGFDGTVFTTVRRGELLKLDIVPETYQKALDVYYFLSAADKTDPVQPRRD